MGTRKSTGFIAQFDEHKIEHRLFSHITMNLRGQPPTSHEIIVETIAATITPTVTASGGLAWPGRRASRTNSLDQWASSPRAAWGERH